MFSEMHKIGRIEDTDSGKTLNDLMMRVFAEGLEGLVMKDVNVSDGFRNSLTSVWHCNGITEA